MNYLDSITKIATGVGSVGILIGFLIAYKSGLLSFVWNLKKNGNGNRESDILKEINELKENHLHTIETIMSNTKQEISELRRELNEHSQQEVVLLNKIVFLLEIKT